MIAEFNRSGRPSAAYSIPRAPRMGALPEEFFIVGNLAPAAMPSESVYCSPKFAAREPELELFVRDLERSVSFYLRLGFSVAHAQPDAAELTWGNHRLRLHRPQRLRWAFAGESDATPRTHLRLAVADVDALWQRALELDLRLVEPLTDHPDGTRDFMLADPDGFGVRFVEPPLPERRATD